MFVLSTYISNSTMSLLPLNFSRGVGLFFFVFSISGFSTPQTTLLQDLKDLFRKSGHVVFTNTDANGDGATKQLLLSNSDKYDYQGCILSVKENIASGNSNGNGTTGRSPSPRRRSPSPRGRSASPRGRSVSPRAVPHLLNGIKI
ncbi:hypothetical protein BSLG_003457 [Batrachochytrium salamandrivorans]|nr:hypothetical protein BSLG_003457 [Batrachochytrium salamandrivorans]